MVVLFGAGLIGSCALGFFYARHRHSAAAGASVGLLLLSVYASATLANRRHQWGGGGATFPLLTWGCGGLDMCGSLALSYFWIRILPRSKCGHWRELVSRRGHALEHETGLETTLPDSDSEVRRYGALAVETRTCASAPGEGRQAFC